MEMVTQAPLLGVRGLSAQNLLTYFNGDETARSTSQCTSQVGQLLLSAFGIF